MGKRSKKALSLLMSAVLATTICGLPATAFAAGGLSGTVDSTTNWKVPTSSMQNIVVKGSGVNQVPYKVITTWANAWALSGPDYLGISNSGPLNQQGGGSASSNLANAQNDTLLGIWASSANEVPNAYNWNFFYNLSLQAQGAESVDWSAIDVQNGSAPGFDSESGVWAPFKYRPEIIWTSNSLSAAGAKSAIDLIKAGKYYTDTSAKYWSSSNDDKGKDNYTDDTSKNGTIKMDGVEAVEDASDYALPGDSSYDPYIMGAVNQTPLTFTDSFYTLAGYAEQVISDTAANAKANVANTDSSSVANGDVVVATDGSGANADTLWKITKKTSTGARASTTYTLDTSNITWKNVNRLARTTRYETSAEAPMTARECALAIEKLTRGAVYYALAQIDDGKVAKKKVAFLTGDPSNGSATVVKYDFVDQIGQGSTGGKTGVAALAVDQLTGTKVADGSSNGGVTFTTYTVTADDLVSCDYIVDANGSMTTNQIQTWVANNVSSYANKQRALNDVQYLTNSPAIMNGHNFTTEKLIWGAFNLDFFYPELFPNMELTTWWYDNIYHLSANNIKTAMQWGLGNASLPAETDLSRLGAGYSTADLDSKFKEGYDFYQTIKGTAPYNTEQFATLAPSDTFTAWASTQTALADTISVTGTTSYSKTTADKAFKLNAVSNIANAQMQYVSSVPSVASVAADGTVTPLKAGTTTITVTASKARYNSGSLAVTVKVGKAAPTQANTLTVKGKTVSVKAGKTVAKSKAYTISKAKGTLSFKKTSGNSKITVNKSSGKISVSKSLKAGKYKVKVKITAAGNDTYKSGSKTATVTLKVKK